MGNSLWLPLFLCSVALYAAPEGFTCKAGDASYTRAGANSIVRSSERAIVHWDSFSLDAHETLHFDSPAVLNRVTSLLPSEIHGAIHSNGTVWLINSKGIVIGPQGRINAANFLASTLDVLDGDFLDGSEFVFAGTQGRIKQQGTIECPNGYVMLMSAESVEQSGTIRAAKVGIGVGNEILFVPKSSPLMAVRLQNIEDTSNCYAKAIQHKGLIEAMAFEERGGEVYLVAEKLSEVTGEIIAPGGIVHVLGENVGVVDQGMIDVSAPNGGGTILIGGDYQGSNPDIRNAKLTVIGEDALLKANATENGNGGKVIVWSDEKTFYHGFIDFRGGPEGGDGGFAETSGLFLDFKGTATGKAPCGKNGEILLDPTDITITGIAHVSGSFTGGVWTSTAATATIAATTAATSVQTLLLAGTNVTIDTSSQTGGPYANPGTITISTAIDWSGTASTLTLIADQNITINSALTATTGSMNFTANGEAAGAYNGINVNAALSASAGTITLVGTAGANGIGVVVGTGGSVNAVTTTITGTGGTGVANQNGVQLTGTGVLGGANTTTLNVNGFGGGTTSGGVNSNNYGIRIGGGTLQTNSGSVTLNGQGGGSGTGGANYGVIFNTAVATYTSITTLTISGMGGGGSGSSQRGVSVEQNLNTAGAIQFIDCRGGLVGGNNNRGLHVGAAVTAGTSIFCDKMVGGGDGTGAGHLGLYLTTGGQLNASTTIQALGVKGGNGTSGNIGFHMDGTGVLGSANTTSILVVAEGGGLQAGGANNNNEGIRIQGGTIQTNTGTVTLIGQGGGSGSGSTNTGVRFVTGPVTFTNIGTLILTGRGGSGTAGSHRGVSVELAIGSASTGTIQFTDCIGGVGGLNNMAVRIAVGAVTATTSITLDNLTGGEDATQTGQYGLYITTGGQLSAPMITGTNITGGVGSAGSAGMLMDGTGILGNETNTTSISITATGGTGTSSNHGIQISAGSVLVAATGTVFFNGIGAGSAGSTGNTGTFLLGGTYSNNISQFTMQGAGGIGNSSFGVRLRGVTMAFTGNTDITFQYCNGGMTGGSGLGVTIDTAASITTLGDVLFQHIQGGGASTSNYGVSISSGNTVAGATITATDVSGGALGTTNNHGFYLLGTLGNSNTTLIDITASSGGTTSNNYGVILQGGAITMTAMGGTVNLKGTGTGGSGGSSNLGIFILDNTGPVSSSFTNVDAIQLTGIGGQGNSSLGIRVENAISITGSTDITFKDCVAGSGDGSVGVSLRGNIQTSGTITFNNISGNGTAVSWGVDLRALLDGATITGTGMKGSATGSDTNYGFILNGGTLGSTNTTSINLSATGGGVNNDNRGIYLAAGSIAASGPVTFNGVANPLTIGTGNNGIEVRGVTFGSGITSLTFIGTGGGTGTNMGSTNTGVLFAAANPTFTAPSSITTFTIQGVGGAGASEGVGMGRALDLGSTATNFIFQNCVGGPGAPGVRISNSIISTGSCTFTNCTGGNSSTDNYGISMIAGGLINVQTISGSNIHGGAGTDTNIGFNMTGGNLGGANTSTITLTAGSFGTGINNHGIWLSGGTVQASGTVTLIGNGSTAATGDGSSGIVVDGVTLSSVTTLTLSGTGGSGGAGTRGIDIGAVVAPTLPASLTAITLTGHGGIGSSLTDGVRISTSLNALSASNAALTFLNCTGGNSGIGANISSAVTSSTITFTSVQGSGNGVEVATGGALNATTTITGTGIVGGASAGSSGFITSGGSVGSGSTTMISITASSQGSGGSNNGILLGAGTWLASDSITLVGSGSTLASTTANVGILANSASCTLNAPEIFLTGTGGVGTTDNHGVYWNNGALGVTMVTTSVSVTGTGGGTGGTNNGVLLFDGDVVMTGGTFTAIGNGGGSSGGAGSNNYGIAITDTTFTGIDSFNFTGTGGRGSGGAHHGIIVNSAATLALSNSTTFTASGGTGGNTNTGVNFARGLTISSGTLNFFNCNGGNGGTTNYGVWVQPGFTVTAPILTASNINGGSGTGSDHGFYLNGATLTCSGAINISASTSGSSGSNSSGIRIDTSGTGGIIGTGTTLILTGIGTVQNVTNSHGIHITGALTTITRAGDITLTGTSGIGTGSSGIAVDSGAAITGTAAAAITFNGEGGSSGDDCQLGLSTITSANGAITFNDAVVLTGNPIITSTGSTITFNDPINGAFILSIDDATTLTFAQVVGGTTPLVGLVIDGAVNNLRIDNNISITSALTIDATTATRIGGSSTIDTDGTAITWNGPIDEAVGTTADLTLDGGATTLGDNIGAMTALHTFAAIGPVTLGASIGVTATESIAFSNTIDGAQTLTLTGGDVTLSGIVGGTTRPTALTIVNSDTALIGANVNLTGPFSAGTGLIQLQGNITTTSDDVTFSGPVDVTGSRTIDTSVVFSSNEDVTFEEPVNGPGGLTIIGDTVTFVSTAGASTSLDFINVTAASAVIGGNQVAVNGITYAAPVTTNTTVTFTNQSAGGITFESTINTGGNPLTLSAPNSAIAVTGAITTGSGDFTAHAGDSLTFSGSITTTNGDVNIESTGSSIVTTGINAGTGSIFLQPSAGITLTALGNIPNGTITLAGDLTGGVLSLAPNARADYPSIATIFSPPSTNITLQGTSLTVGPQEAIAILGNFTVGLATIGSIGDLVVQQDLNIESPIFVSYRRDPIVILGSDGVLYESPASHVVYKANLVFVVPNLTANIEQAPTLVQADLQYIPESYTLNFDPEAVPAPPVPPPLPITVRENDINTMWVALSELTDRLPIYWVKKVSAPICWKNKEHCFYEELSFESFLPENAVE